MDIRSIHWLSSSPPRARWRGQQRLCSFRNVDAISSRWFVLSRCAPDLFIVFMLLWRKSKVHHLVWGFRHFWHQQQSPPCLVRCDFISACNCCLILMNQQGRHETHINVYDSSRCTFRCQVNCSHVQYALFRLVSNGDLWQNDEHDERGLCKNKQLITVENYTASMSVRRVQFCPRRCIRWWECRSVMGCATLYCRYRLIPGMI